MGGPPIPVSPDQNRNTHRPWSAACRCRLITTGGAVRPARSGNPAQAGAGRRHPAVADPAPTVDSRVSAGDARDPAYRPRVPPLLTNGKPRSTVCKTRNGSCLQVPGDRGVAEIVSGPSLRVAFRRYSMPLRGVGSRGEGNHHYQGERCLRRHDQQHSDRRPVVNTNCMRSATNSRNRGCSRFHKRAPSNSALVVAHRPVSLGGNSERSSQAQG